MVVSTISTIWVFYSRKRSEENCEMQLCAMKFCVNRKKQLMLRLSGNSNIQNHFSKNGFLKKSQEFIDLKKFPEECKFRTRIMGISGRFTLHNLVSAKKKELCEKFSRERNLKSELFSAFLKIFQRFSSLSLKMSLKLAPVHNWRNYESPVSSEIYFGRVQKYLEGFCWQNEIAALFLMFTTFVLNFFLW